jgi:hypothetical protein
MANELQFIDPSADNSDSRVPMAPRPIDLAGKIIGMVDNTKEQGSLILETFAQALREHYGAARVIIRRKEHYSKPATDELINELAKEVQVAVAAVGG